MNVFQIFNQFSLFLIVKFYVRNLLNFGISTWAEQLNFFYTPCIYSTHNKYHYFNLMIMLSKWSRKKHAKSASSHHQEPISSTIDSNSSYLNSRRTYIWTRIQWQLVQLLVLKWLEVYNSIHIKDVLRTQANSFGSAVNVMNYKINNRT